ncbi:MAG TPA: LEA type 2 family protein [Myxococcales bacterium]|jgi:hypothetical protein
MAARRTRRALAAAAALPFLLLAPACFGPTRQVISRVEEPSASMRELTARSFDRQHADLRLELELSNPGAALAIASADYELLAEGRAFAIGTAKLEVTVPAGGSASVTLPLQLAYLDLPYAARNLFRAGQRVQLVARGTLRGPPGLELPAAIPFDGEAVVGLTFGPDGP